MAVRLATACDLGITARIAARGFSLSPWNAFYRPYAKDYPEDMENSYRREQEEALLSGKKLFTVIETNVKNASGQSQDIVGFAIWNYAEGSDRARHDLPESTIGRPTSDENKSAPLNHTLEWLLRLWTRIYDTLTYPRDSSTDPYRGKLLFDATDAAVHKYFKGFMELDNMAVDPRHFRHGFGTKLCKYGMDMAMGDGLSVGVIASGSGLPL